MTPGSPSRPDLLPLDLAAGTTARASGRPRKPSQPLPLGGDIGTVIANPCWRHREPRCGDLSLPHRGSTTRRTEYSISVITPGGGRLAMRWGLVHDFGGEQLPAAGPAGGPHGADGHVARSDQRGTFEYCRWFNHLDGADAPSRHRVRLDKLPFSPGPCADVSPRPSLFSLAVPTSRAIRSFAGSVQVAPESPRRPMRGIMAGRFTSLGSAGHKVGPRTRRRQSAIIGRFACHGAVSHVPPDLYCVGWVR